MMDPDTPCVINATFADWRTVKGRKMLQLIFEVPLETQGEVLTLLGPPDSVGSKWCMIALKDVKPAQARETESQAPSTAFSQHAPAVGDKAGTSPTQASEASGPPKDEGAYLVRQCAILCGEFQFQKYLAETTGYLCKNADQARNIICERLGIVSRGDIRENVRAQNEWKLFHAIYKQWETDQKWAGSVRR